MADVKTEQEPSIEEILESIRQIISEDGTAPAAASAPESKKAEAQPAAATPAATPAPQPPSPSPAAPMPSAPAAPATIAEPIIDLTEKVMPESPMNNPVEQTIPEGDPLLSSSAADASTASMAKLLSTNIAVERELPGRVGNVTLEDMTRELLRPIVKSWLDQNLPKIVEKTVQKEIEKLSRKAMDQ